MADKPQYTVGVGLTHSPRAYESIRVDVQIQGVTADTLDLALQDEGRIIIERLFARVYQTAFEEMEESEKMLYGTNTLHAAQTDDSSAPFGNFTRISGRQGRQAIEELEVDGPPPLGDPFGMGPDPRRGDGFAR